MTETAVLADLAEFTGRNIAHNLDFVPEDKLRWKPEATASSVAEIIDHIGNNISNFLAAMESGEWKSDYQPVTTIEEAKRIIIEKTAAFADWIRQAQPEELQKDFLTPVGPFPGKFIVPIAVFDLPYHNGQICYLQSLWGDKDTHMLDMPGLHLENTE